MSGTTPVTVIASWDSTGELWLPVDALSDGLFAPLEPFSGRWPVSGMTRSGLAYALPTPAPHMDGSVSSSLPTPRATRGGSSTKTLAPLPTPEANIATNGGSQPPDKRKAGGHSVSLQDVVEHTLM